MKPPLPPKERGRPHVSWNSEGRWFLIQLALLIFVMASLTQHPRAAIIGGKPPFAVALAVVLRVLTLFPLITLLLPRYFGY